MAPSSPSLLADVMATSKITFIKRRDSEHEVIDLKGADINKVRTRLRSHWGSDRLNERVFSQKALPAPYS